jgi:hypothetical protein
MPTIFCSQQPAPPSKSDTHDTLNPTTNHIHVNPSLAPSRPTGAISKCIIDFCFPRSLRHDITTTPLIVRDALSHTYIHITTSQTCLTSNPNSRSPKKNLQTQQHQPHRNYAQVNTTPRRPTHTHKPLVRRLIQHALQHHRRREQNRREQKHKRDPARRTFLVPPSLLVFLSPLIRSLTIPTRTPPSSPPRALSASSLTRTAPLGKSDRRSVDPSARRAPWGASSTRVRMVLQGLWSVR